MSPSDNVSAPRHETLRTVVNIGRGSRGRARKQACVSSCPRAVGVRVSVIEGCVNPQIGVLSQKMSLQT